MDLFSLLTNHEAKISLVGLGYVGMPIAIELAKHFDVIGFDINEKKIKQYIDGFDATNEVGPEALAATTVEFTSDESRLEEALFHIVAVPTPVNQDKTPDLSPVVGASETVGRHLRKGSIVVFESTVYPGVTEEVCAPILEKESGLKCGVDFKVGYSPERINPGDRVHTLTKITKVVSGMDEESLGQIQRVYDTIIEAGTFPVSSIRTAEAVKVCENSQRDINIAFVNELAMVFDRMGIDTNEVIDGMNTKWNSLGFRPGLVGGHCIGVDPYYFTYEAERLGYHSRIILAGRHINDGMGEFVADAAVREMVVAGLAPAKAKVVILGLTFKENCPDTRNTKVMTIVNRLSQYEIKTDVVDPWADPIEAEKYYGVQLRSVDVVAGADCVILAVAHSQFRSMGVNGIKELFGKGAERKVLIDVKGLFNEADFGDAGIHYWRL